MCLDIGDKRIGIAVSDPFCSYSLPVKTYFRKNLKTDIEEILSIIKEKAATAIVCGLPVNFDGTPSVQTEKAQFFIEKLKERTSLKVYSVDERCSTIEAEETLIYQGKTRKERKSVIDSLAAATILQGFLNDLIKQQKKENTMSDNKKHTHNCDCGCEHTHAEGENCNDACDCGCEDDIIELIADNGEKLKFYFIGTIEYKGKNYSAFEPAEEIEGLSEDDLVIFELSGTEGEGADLLPIEDDKLLDEVFEEFCRVLDEEDEFAE